MNLKQLRPIAWIAMAGFWIPLLLGVPMYHVMLSNGGFWVFFWSLVLFFSQFQPDEKPKNDQAGGEA